MDQFIRDYENENKQTHIVEDMAHYNQITNHISEKGTKVSSFSILQQNIRSIAKNFDEMKIFLSQFDNHFDIIILTETWQIFDTNFFQICGYEMIYNHGKVNQNDGTVVYIKSKYNHSSTTHVINNIQVIKTKLDYLKESITITAIYRPPSTSPDLFNDEFRTYLTTCANTDLSFIVGDINIDILSDCEYSHEYLNILSEAGYRSLINNPTRVESETCLDHIFLKTKTDLNNCMPIIFENNITDHYTTINLLQRPSSSVQCEKKRTHIRRFNQEKFKRSIQKANLNTKLRSKDAEQAANYLIEHIKNAMEEATTLIKIKPSEKKRKEWITAGIIQAINKKQKLFATWKKDFHNTELKERYLLYRNTLNTLIKITKNTYFTSKIDKNAGNKSVWDAINSITSNKNRKNTEIKQIKTATGTIIGTEKEIADTFNQHYTNLGKVLASKITKPKANFNNTSQTINPNTMFITPTDEQEVKKFIKELKMGKAPGLDNITPEILNNNIEILATPLTIIINKMLTTGACPKVFKTAVIKPLYKNGDKDIPENYRPISLISNLAKIFEKVVKARLTKFFSKYNIISHSQYGFQEGRSTQDAMVQLISEVQGALDTSKPSLCVFIDLAKAFDTVNHRQLIKTLNNAGIRGIAAKLFENYLKDRTQYVKIGNTLSEGTTVEYGVPQGTVLGPILFTLYVNELFNLPSKGRIVAFADDTAIFYKDNNWKDLKQKAEEDLLMIKNWFDSKTLTINFNKTKYIAFTCHNYNFPTFDNLTIYNQNNGNITIENTEYIKYLGITIDQHLRWNKHVDTLIKKLRGVLFKFKSLKQILNEDNLKIAYYGLVQSLLQYGIIAWGSVSRNYLQKLEIMQKRFLKLIFNKEYRYPTEQLYTETKVYCLRQLYYKNLLILQYKNKHMLTKVNHPYATRSKVNENNEIKRVEKKIGQKSFKFLGPRIFNKLPTEIRNSQSVNQFKYKIKRWIDQQNYSVLTLSIEKYV